MIRKTVITAILSGLLVPVLAFAQVHQTDEIAVELIAETNHVVPGETLWLAIRLDPIEHWHTYWKFGGDSGEATAASNWQLPVGVTAGDIVWPTPEWTPFPGSDLVTFAYEREVLLPIPITVPATFSDSQFNLSTTIDWQVCEEVCIPGSADFSLSLPVADSTEADPRWVAAFAQTRASIPTSSPAIQTRFNTHDGKVNIMFDADTSAFVDVSEAYFFTEQGRVMQYAPYRENIVEDSRLQISFAQHRRMPEDISQLTGVLSLTDSEGNTRGFEINASKTDVAWQERITVELLAETTNIVPGLPTQLAVRLKAAPGWHTYWKMGGDSGEPTRTIDWAAPEGTIVGDLQWPAPHWLPFPGSDLVNYGYEGEVVLPFDIQIPADTDNEFVTLSTTVEWNVCELICIADEQRLDLKLPVAEVAELDATHEPLFLLARKQLPVQDHDIQFLIASAGERVSLGFQSAEPVFEDVTDAWFFPDQRRVIANGPLRDVTITPAMIQITHNQPRRMLTDLSAVYGTLVVTNAAGERRAYDFVDPAADVNQTTIMPLAISDADSGGNANVGVLGFLGILLAAMAGGLILNLMPCVFPVLSLKALSFAANAGASARKQRLDGLVYSGGVIVSFLILATVLIVLRAGGEQLGWGFQLQEPWFIAMIIFLFFAMALSLSGVFEFGTSLMNVGSDLTRRSEGYRRSFFTGVLATLVATPCTAPFMGPALGFALTQPWVIAMAVFTALGLGLALPILLLSFLPQLAHYMPKPGSWMVTFKEFMAFPLYVTALYFLWVLGTQVGVMGMSLVLGGCVLLAFTVWFINKQRKRSGPLWRYSSAGAAIVCLGIMLYLIQTPFLAPVSSAGSASASLNADGEYQRDFEPFSAQRLEELQSAGRPVFINMTAAWCITCLANEQTTLGTERVRQAMEDNDITYLKGDYTNEDPEIFAVLSKFNRPSVPLYLFYPGDSSEEPKILPQILTPSIVVRAFTDSNEN